MLFHRKTKRSSRKSPAHRSRSPRRRSRSPSRDQSSSRYGGTPVGRGAVSGSSLLAELSKFEKGREVVLKKEQLDTKPGY